MGLLAQERGLLAISGSAKFEGKEILEPTGKRAKYHSCRANRDDIPEIQ